MLSLVPRHRQYRKQRKTTTTTRRRKNIRISHTFGTYGLTVASWFIQFENVRDEGAETIAAVNCARRRSSRREKKHPKRQKCAFNFFGFFLFLLFFVSHALFSQISFLFHFRLSTLIPIRYTKPSCTSTVCICAVFIKICSVLFRIKFFASVSSFSLWEKCISGFGYYFSPSFFSRTHWSSLTPDEHLFQILCFVDFAPVVFVFSFVFLSKILITLPSMVW